MTVNIVLLGPPGSGKGTQALYVCERFRIPQIGADEVLRAAARSGSRLGLAAKAAMDAGALVPDDLIIGLVKERLGAPDCRGGYLFDGFPRTLAQAEALRSAGVRVGTVLEIDVPDEHILERVAGRRVHAASGRTYHLHSHPPKRPGLDDVTGEPLVQRDDDRQHVVRERLQAYREQTAPLTDFYRGWSEAGHPDGPRYRKVSGLGTIGEIRERVATALAG